MFMSKEPSPSVLLLRILTILLLLASVPALSCRNIDECKAWSSTYFIRSILFKETATAAKVEALILDIFNYQPWPVNL